MKVNWLESSNGHNSFGKVSIVKNQDKALCYEPTLHILLPTQDKILKKWDLLEKLELLGRKAGSMSVSSDTSPFCNIPTSYRLMF